MSEILKIRVQHRRKTADEWNSSEDILLEGELGIETDTNKVKVGDGSSLYRDLKYIGGSTEETTTALTKAALESESVKLITGSSADGGKWVRVGDDGKLNLRYEPISANHAVRKSYVDKKVGAKADKSHNHNDLYSPISHNHDEIYVKLSDINGLIERKIQELKEGLTDSIRESAPAAAPVENSGIKVIHGTELYTLTVEQVVLLYLISEQLSFNASKINKVLKTSSIGAETGVQAISTNSVFRTSKAGIIANKYIQTNSSTVSDLREKARQAVSEGK